MAFTNFPDGFAQGLSVRGMPLLQMQPGEVFFVSNSTVLRRNQRAGSNNNRGTFLDPFATIQYALDRAVANRGDIVFVGPGHVETISSATVLSLNKAGTAIVGLGMGSTRPTLTFTAAAGNIPVTAVNMSIQNFLFDANAADIASVFTATGTNTPRDFAIENCEFRDRTATLNFITIMTGNATANSLDGFSFTRNVIRSRGTTAATTAIKLLETTRRVRITDNFGVWAILNNVAALLAGGSFNHLDIEIARNRCVRPNTSSDGGSFISGTGNAWTGHAYDNYFWQLDNTAGIWIPTGTGLAFSQNFSPITGLADRSGLINPAAV